MLVAFIYYLKEFSKQSLRTGVINILHMAKLDLEQFSKFLKAIQFLSSRTKFKFRSVEIIKPVN